MEIIPKKTNLIQQRHYRLYGLDQGTKITQLLNILNITNVEKFKQTGYKDAAVLAKDIEVKRAIAVNDNGQILDSNNRIITHTGNGIYSVVDPDNDQLILQYYSVDENQNDHITDHLGNIIVLDDVNKLIKNTKCSALNNTQGSALKSTQDSAFKGAQDKVAKSAQYKYKKKGKKVGKHQHNKKNISHIVGFVADLKLVTRLHLVKSDYIKPGVHLYYYEWNKTARHVYNLSGCQYGLFNEEIQLHLPHLLVNSLNTKNPTNHQNHHQCKIYLSTLEAQQNHQVAKIGFMIMNRRWFNHYMTNLFIHHEINHGPNLV